MAENPLCARVSTSLIYLILALTIARAVSQQRQMWRLPLPEGEGMVPMRGSIAVGPGYPLLTTVATNFIYSFSKASVSMRGNDSRRTSSR